MPAFTLAYRVRGKLPQIRYARIKEKILGRRYALSVALVDKARMRALNRAYRGKSSTTDILAFPYAKGAGEIIIHLPSARAKAKYFSLSSRDYLLFLFIHGLLHLKGIKHGRIMEKLEDRWCRSFGLPLPKR